MSTYHAEGHNTNNGTTVTVTIPAGASVGDYLLMAITSASTSGWVDPPGWTKLAAQTDTSYDSRLYGRTCVAGDPGANTVVTTSGVAVSNAWSITAWSSVDTVNPITAIAVAAETGGGGTSHVTPTLATAIIAHLVEIVGDKQSTSAETWTAPAGYTKRSEAAASGTNACSVAVGDKAADQAEGTYGGDTWTVTNSSAVGSMFTVALKPAASTGPTRAHWPTVVCEVAFNADPNSATAPTWTDLSSRLLGFDIRRGRTYELAHTETGEASIQLRNDDGALDPSNAASAYYPNVLVGRRVRLRAIWGATTYDLTNSYVERWPQQWAGGFGHTPMQAVDGFAVLSARKFRAVLVESTLSSTIAAPVRFYPLSETSIATTATDILAPSGTTPNPLVYLGTAGGTFAFGTPMQGGGTFAAVSEKPWLTLSAAGGSNVRNGGYALKLPPVPLVNANSTGFMFETWVAPNCGSGAGNGFIAHQSNIATKALQWSLTVNSTTGVVQFTLGSGGTTCTGSKNINDAQPHHVLIAYQNRPGSGTNEYRLYVDGVLDGITSFGASTIGGFDSTNGMLLIGSDRGSGATNTWFNGQLANIGVYTTPLIPALTLAADRWLAGLSTYYLDTADARIARLLAWVPWRLGTSLAASVTKMGTLDGLEDTTALDAILDTASDENGVVWCKGDGTLAFASRRTRMLTTTSSYTFGDGGGAELPYDELGFDYDPTYVYNDVQLTMHMTQRVAEAEDVASQARYFPRQLVDEYNLDASADAELTDAANWLLNTHKDAGLRPTELVFTPSANDALWPAALGIDVGTRLTVKRRPLGGHTVSVDCFVEGIAHEVTESTWAVRVQLSPAPLQVVIADDATYGLADGPYVAGY